MDFGALPPEINSAKMHSGAGAGAMLAAAAAWENLAADLYSVASSIQSVISGLAVAWLGLPSVLMSAAAAQYVAWIRLTAAQAEQTGIQIADAASAYEEAFRMTVPPPMIAENRALFCWLVETNVAGENASLIADADAAYDEMWDQDAVAMYGYESAAAAAIAATAPFEAAPQIVNEARLGRQAMVGEQAINTAAANGLQNWWPSNLSPVSNLLSMANDNCDTVDSMLSMAGTAGSALAGALPAAQQAVANTVIAVGNEAAALQPAMGGALGRSAALAVVAGPDLSAGLGRAVSVGSLSVPQSWVAANEAVTPVVRGLPVTSLAGAAESGPVHMLGGMPMGQLAHGAVGSGVSNVFRTPPRAFVMPSSPAAG